MRISTTQFHQMALDGILTQQNAAVRTQNQLASGKKILNPSDDPVGSVHVLELERALNESTQFGKNSDQIKGRLTLEEQALADAGTTMDQIRSLTVQAANTGGLGASDLQSIGTQINQLEQQLLDIANRKDGSGEYLFSGGATTTIPFVRSGAGVVSYAGNQLNRVVQIAPNQRVQDSDSGFDVFMNVPEGNGTFATSATGTNAGNGVITVGSVTNKAAWVPGNYTLSFTTATTWQVTDSTAAVVASGNYTSGNAIAFNGIQVAVSGTPAAGDSFAISQAHTQDFFKTLDNLVNALNQQPLNIGQLNTALGGALQQLDQGSGKLLSVRTAVGARLQTLDDGDSARDDQSVQLKSSLSTLQDVDYATAVTELNRQSLGLQAAQQSYTKIAQLSLFNFL